MAEEMKVVHKGVRADGSDENDPPTEAEMEAAKAKPAVDAAAPKAGEKSQPAPSHHADK